MRCKRTHALRTSGVMIASFVSGLHESAHLLLAEGFVAAAKIGSLGQSTKSLRDSSLRLAFQRRRRGGGEIVGQERQRWCCRVLE